MVGSDVEMLHSFFQSIGIRGATRLHTWEMRHYTTVLMLIKCKENSGSRIFLNVEYDDLYQKIVPQLES